LMNIYIYIYLKHLAVLTEYLPEHLARYSPPAPLTPDTQVLQIPSVHLSETWVSAAT
jgi:hypothetical protein